MLTTEREIAELTATAKNKHRLLGVALASGLAAASLNMAAPANAWCIGLSGIDIGGGCDSTFGNFSLGLGPDAQASSNGFLTGAIAVGNGTSAHAAGVLTAAWAGGTNSAALTDGLVSWAVAQGDADALGDLVAVAGAVAGDFANFAFNLGNATDGATSGVVASNGSANLAANLGGNANVGEGHDLSVFAGGVEDEPSFANAALNLIGNRNRVEAFGSGNLAIAVGNPFAFPNGSDSTVLVGDILNDDPAELSLGFHVQPPFITPACDSDCGNTVTVTRGRLSLAGAIGLVNRDVAQDGIGITINTPLNPPASNPTTLAASSKQRILRPSLSTFTSRSGINTTTAAADKKSNLFRPSLNAAPNAHNATSPGGSLRKTIGERIKKWVNKVSDTKNNVTSGQAGGTADPGAASPGSDE